MGADPVAMAVMHAEGRPIDAFVVRKAAKAHGMQRQIEGPDVVGKRVLVVEDTTTTGNSPLTAVKALRDAGAIVVGVATVVDRATGADAVIAAEGLEYRSPGPRRSGSELGAFSQQLKGPFVRSRRIKGPFSCKWRPVRGRGRTR